MQWKRMCLRMTTTPRTRLRRLRSAGVGDRGAKAGTDCSTAPRGWDNFASKSLDKSLALVQYGVDIHVS